MLIGRKVVRAIWQNLLDYQKDTVGRDGEVC